MIGGDVMRSSNEIGSLIDWAMKVLHVENITEDNFLVVFLRQFCKPFPARVIAVALILVLFMLIVVVANAICDRAANGAKNIAKESGDGTIAAFGIVLLAMVVMALYVVVVVLMLALFAAVMALIFAAFGAVYGIAAMLVVALVAFKSLI